MKRIDLPEFLSGSYYDILPTACTGSQGCTVESEIDPCGLCEHASCMSCQATCEGCEDCEGDCMSACQTSSCMDCQSNCERGCQDLCEVFEEGSGCSGVCQIGCQVSCETSECDYCQDACMETCQTGNNCQSFCEGDNCQFHNESPDGCYQSGGGVPKPIGNISISVEAIDRNYIAVIARCDEATSFDFEILKSGSWVVDGRYNTSLISAHSFNRLSPNTTYSIRVRGYNSKYSGYSSVKNIATGGDNFRWIVEKIKGKPFNLQAYEWNRLQVFIDQKRIAKGLTSYPWIKPKKGENYTATMYNQAISAITSAGGTETPKTCNKGEQVKAEYLNQLVTVVNKL